MGPPPVVTGISPKEGPPGTRITIRGENLGREPRDLIGLTICGYDCLLSSEWKSSSKIIARSGPSKGRGNIIVTTRSGGQGTSTVEFRGYHETIGALKESAVWIEEAPIQNILWGRRSLSPNSYQQDDPLGLSVEENDKKIPEDDLNELFPDSSGDLMADNFSPGWFLLENHHATSFNDLKAGLSFIKRKVDGQKVGQLTFLKKNVGSVMDQLETLLNLNENYKKDMVVDKDVTGNFEKIIKECVNEANILFDNVLTRREKADRTRSALLIMQKFRFLFTPTNIQQLIEIRNQTKFEKFDKTLTPEELKQKQKLLRRKLVLDLIMDAQKLQSSKKLETTDEVLNSAFNAIEQQSKNILDSFDKSYQQFLTNKNNNLPSHKKDHNKFKNKTDSSVPSHVIFIEDLTRILSFFFPTFWKMGQTYFTGNMFHKPDQKAETFKQHFKDLTLKIIDRYDELIKEVIFSNQKPDLQQFLTPWLPYCLRLIRTAYKLFIKLDIPNEPLDKINNLIEKLKIFTMICLFKECTDDIKQLPKQETWKLQYGEHYGGITELPFKVEQIIQQMIQLIHESVLSCELREKSIKRSPIFQRDYEQSCLQLFQEIHKTYEKLAFLNNVNQDNSTIDSSLNVSQLLGNSFMVNTSYLTNNNTSQSPPSFEHRLLIMLSNCQYTIRYLLDKICETFINFDYPSPQNAINHSKNGLLELDRLLMEAYLEQKCDPLVGTIEPSMYLGRFDWNTSYKTTDVSPYIKECLNNLIIVHTEVHTISSNLVDKVLGQIIETVAEEISRLMSCFRKFSEQGNVQARVDILALSKTLDAYCSQSAKNSFKDALSIVPPIQDNDKRVIDEILNKFEQNMALQIMCFKKNTKIM